MYLISALVQLCFAIYTWSCKLRAGDSLKKSFADISIHKLLLHFWFVWLAESLHTVICIQKAIFVYHQFQWLHANRQHFSAHTIDQNHSRYLTTMSVEHVYRTKEARALREHYDKLVDSIQKSDLPVFGARFFSRHIISRETMEMVGSMAIPRAVRTSKLMLTVMAGLDIHPDKFESVLDVFREEHVYTQFSTMIKESYSEFG